MARLAGERGPEEGDRALECRFGSDHPGPERQHVHVVVLHTLMRRVCVVADRRPDAGHLVCRDGRTDPGSADEDAAVRLAGLDGVAQPLREVGVVIGGIRAIPTKVDQLMAEIGDRQPGEQLRLEGGSGMIGGEGDAHGAKDTVPPPVRSGRDPSRRSGPRRLHRQGWSGASRSGRRPGSGCGRAVPRGRPGDRCP